MNRIIKNHILLLMAFAGMQGIFAQDHAGKIQVGITGGYSAENLQWSIAGNANGQDPDILSELRWKNISGPSAGMQVQWSFLRRWRLNAGYDRHFFLSGKVYDTDYGDNGRTNAVYDAQFSAGQGRSDRWRIGIGYALLQKDHLSLIPFIGYGIFYQWFHILDHAGAFNDLNSTYSTRWTGPTARLICSLQLTGGLHLDGGIGYTQVRYRASANWNLIHEFSHPESFRHTANGYGMDGDAGLRYDLAPHHSISIGAGYSRWQTGKGLDELHLASGQTRGTQLNEVRSAGFRIMAGWLISL